MSGHADTIRDAFSINRPAYVAAVDQALDALLAENQRLRDALERIADNYMECLSDCIEGPPTCGCEKRIARAALARDTE